jgi:hypothetical protein
MEAVTRVIVTSRNLTFDRSWDTVVCLEEDNAGVTLPRVGDLLDALAQTGLAVSIVSEQNRTRLESLSGTIRKVRFGIPEGFDSMTLHVLGLSSMRSTPSPMPKQARVGLVVSPFLTHSTLAQLSPEWSELTVVSRPDELDRVLADFATHDDGSTPRSSCSTRRVLGLMCSPVAQVPPMPLSTATLKSCSN